MVRLLYAYKDYYPVHGGIEVALRQLASGFAARPGYQVRVLVTDPGIRNTRQVFEDVEIFRAGRLTKLASTPLSLAYPLWMARLSAQADITHLQFPYPPAEMSYLLAGRSKHLVIHYQSDIIRQRRLLFFYHPFLLRVLARADRIIASSPAYIESSPYLQLYRDKCVVIPLAVDPARFDPRHYTSDEIAAFRRRWLSGDGFLIHMHGLYRYYKGIEYLLEALPAILRAYPQTRLLLTGSGHRVALAPLVQKLGLERSVIFTGPVDDAELPLYYAASDLFVLPASHRSEAFGIVLLEAMASERAVISTELGTGTSWINRDGETGLVVPARDAEALSGAVTRLLDKPELRAQMGRAGRQRVAREFTVECMLERTAGVYRDLMAGST